MKVTSSKIELSNLNDEQRADLFKALKAFINFDFQKQNEEEFKSVQSSLLKDLNPLRVQKACNERIIKNLTQTNGFYNWFKELIDSSGWKEPSFYKNLGLGLVLRSALKDLYFQLLVDYSSAIQNTLLDINFNAVDSFGRFKDLCDTIRDGFAFTDENTKKKNGLSTICNAEWELDESKMQNLHYKFKSIIDQSTGKISPKRLEEYKSDRTIMDFIYMALSYLPKVVKDFVGLDDEKANRWQRKAELKPVILNHFDKKIAL